MAKDLEERLVKLLLPHPLTLLVDRVLSADNPDASHEDLLNAWEAAIKLSACCMWAVRRSLSIPSAEFDRQCRGLVNPSFGHWVGMLREGHRILAGCTGAEAQALDPLVSGLDARIDAGESLPTVAERLTRLAGKRIELGSRSVLGLLQALPAYRNATKGHEQRDSAFRQDSVVPLLEGLVSYLEACPPLGAYTLVVVHSLELTDGGCRVRMARMHGHGQPLESREVSRPTGERLRKGHPYLFLGPELFVPLFPIAAAERAGDVWRLGWIKQKIRDPRFAFDAYTSGSFQVKLDTADYLALLGGDGEAHEAGLSDEVLGLDPWRGLPAYDEAHSPVFFGREEEIERAVSRLFPHGCIVVCGASGSGKSSLVRAGVVPRLRDAAESAGRPLSLVDLIPGASPMESLRQSLRRASPGSGVDAAAWWHLVDQQIGRKPSSDEAGGLASLVQFIAVNGRSPVVLVDQLEEIATMCPDAGEQARFLDGLADLVRRLGDIQATVLVTVRADLLGPLLRHEGFRALAQERFFPLGGIDRERLQRIVTDPVRGRNVTLDPGLPEVIAGEVGDEPGSLALLSQVLRTLWEDRALFGNRLTKQGYEAAGRVDGALRKQAKDALAEVEALPKEGLGGPAAGALDRIMLQLAYVTDEGTFSRRRTTMGSVSAATGLDESIVRSIVGPFVSRRLLVLGAAGDDPGEDGASESVEVAHEALLAAWPRLSDLLKERKEVLGLRQEIEKASSAWARSGRRRELWSDATSRLRLAEEMVAAGKLDLGDQERGFLAASRGGVRRGKQLAALVMVLLVVLAAAASLSWWRSERALEEAERRTAEAESRRREAARNLSEALMEKARVAAEADEDMLARVLAAAALEQSDLAGGRSPDGVRMLVDLSRHPMPELLSRTQPGYACSSLAYSHDGRTLACARPWASLVLWDLSTGAETHLATDRPGELDEIAFSPDDAAIARGDGRSVVIFDSGTGERKRIIRGHEDPPERIAFSADGRSLITATEYAVRVWDASTGKLIRTRQIRGRDSAGGDFPVAFSRAGDRFASRDLDDAGIHVFAVADMGLVASRPASGPNADPSPAGDDGVLSVAFSPDSKLIAVGLEGGAVDLLDGATLMRASTIPGAGKKSTALAFSPGGDLLASAGIDGTLRIWDVRTTALLAKVRASGWEAVTALAFSPDGSQIANAASDGIVRRWSLASTRRTRVFGSKPNPASTIISPDGTRVARVLASTMPAGTLELSLMSTGEVLEAGLGNARLVADPAFSPDGGMIATADAEAGIRLWTVSGGVDSTAPRTLVSRTLAPASGRIPSEVLFASDDLLVGLIGGGKEGDSVAAWRVDTGEEVYGEPLHAVPVPEPGAAGPDASMADTPAVPPTDAVDAVKEKAGKSNVIVLDEMVIQGAAVPGIGRLAISHDGKTVAFAARDGSVHLLDSASGRGIREMDAGASKVVAVSFVPGGKEIVSWASDGTVVTWDLDSGREVHRHQVVTDSWEGDIPHGRVLAPCPPTEGGSRAPMDTT